MSYPTTSADDAQRPLFVGVDVGGTSIKFGLVDDLGRTLDQTSIPTQDEKGAEDAVRRMGETVETLLAESGLALDDVAAAGLGTPGTLDIPKGMILKPHNLPGWRYFPIRDKLSERLGVPVTYANDATAAAYGEYWIGSGKEHHSMVLLTLGTGVGSGIIIGDLSIDGENSCGGEAGHLVIDCHADARWCPCGQQGHLEAYCSATSVIKRTNEALEAAETETARESSLHTVVDKGEELTGLIIAEHAEAGDRLALDIVMETADFLVAGIVSIMNVIDPAAIVLGGAMTFGGHDTELGRKFLERVSHGARTKSFPIPGERIVIDYAVLGSEAGYIGAAGMARSAWRRSQS